MAIHKTTEDHENLRVAIADAIGKFPDMPADHMLAVLSNVVGQLIALQDQTKYNADQVMSLVLSNIVIGNQNALKQVKGPAAGNA